MGLPSSDRRDFGRGAGSALLECLGAGPAVIPPGRPPAYDQGVASGDLQV